MPSKESSNSAAHFSRKPPYNEEAEQGVLGAALLEPDRVIDLCLQRQLTPESFMIPAHQVLFEVLVDMSLGNRPVDALTVRDYLNKKKLLANIGGGEYLDDLIDRTPTTVHAEYYADIVLDHDLKRRIIRGTLNAVEGCYKDELDAETILNQAEESIFEISGSRRGTVPSWHELVKSAMNDIEEIYETKKGATGISSGYKDLDEKMNGLKPAEMIILAARPSMGKTSLALNIAEHVATDNPIQSEKFPVAVFSLEMSADQLVKRMLCSRARVASHKLTGGYIGEVNHGQLADAASAIMNAPIYLDDTAGLEALELRSRARRLKRKHDIQLVVVDYLQLLNYTKFAKEGRQRETAAISGALKAMAKELNVPVLVLSQLSRAAETRDHKSAVPKLSDLRDSGSIEQDADVVMLLRRPCKYPNDEYSHDLSLAIVDVAKNRNGPTGWVHLNFTDEFMRFDTRIEGVDPDGQSTASDEEGFDV